MTYGVFQLKLRHIMFTSQTVPRSIPKDSFSFHFPHFTYRSVWAYAASGFECAWIWLRRLDIGRACQGHWCRAWLRGWYTGGMDTEYLLTWNTRRKHQSDIQACVCCNSLYTKKWSCPYMNTKNILWHVNKVAIPEESVCLLVYKKI